MDVDIPHDRLTVITGVSGSGKSSLAVDTLFREGQRRYLESLSSHARQLLGKLERPALDAAEGLRPALAVDQRSGVRNPRSTVGTLSEIYDYLRLLFARVGTQHCEACAGRLPQRGADRRAQAGSCPSCGATGPALTASLLSFNVLQGACPSCRGLGVEDRVDPQLLIADPERTLRQGALVPTTPNGYIVYSQVTVEVLDRVCHAHGFSVDVPWRELSDEQRNVVLNGSDRIRVPFGKHPLESRMRWTGITAKPRVEGHYQGLVPIIDEILKHKRNRNVLRFARTFPCSACDGSRLGPAARAVKLAGQTISDWADNEVETLDKRVLALELSGQDQTIAQPVLRAIRRRAELLEQLGLGHLVLSRSSESLSGGEAQRIRMATQVSSGLRGVLYVLDEPSLGLHPRDHSRLQGVLRQLRDGGNTVVSVEHDPTAMLAADWLIDIGPGPGDAGGRVLYSGPPGALLDAKAPTATARESATRQLLHDPPTHHRPAIDHDDGPQLTIRGAAENNLQGIDVSFRLAALNVVTGVSGAGKSTLVNRILARALRRRLHGALSPPGVHTGIDGAEGLGKLISIDQAPIGRTPRSNPATYTKVFDAIRACFAKTPEAQARGLTKGHFSFNVKGGRCELCQGAGVETVGMHFLGDVAVTCSACAGRRFDEAVLTVTYRDHTVLDVLQMSVVEVRRLFDDEPRIRRVLQALMDVGLGYLKLGQPATTLSGGEAQRVKLAAELGRPSKGATLYVLDEPTAGLHPADVDHLLEALRALVARGNTAIVVEHDLQVIRAADWVVDLGPEAGARGGRLVVAGSPKQVARCPQSAIGAALRGELADQPQTAARSSAGPAIQAPIALRAVTTHNLDRLDVDIPHGRLTVITGVSGSGKSSLALDTLFDACRTRFADGLPSYARHFLERGGKAELGAAQGLTPAIAIGPKPPVRNPRSTVGTMTETDAALRLLMSRAGHPKLRASMFSFNDHDGACATCRGLGTVTTCDPEGLINDPTLALAGGAMGGSRSGRFHGDPHGRTMALLTAVGTAQSIDFSVPWMALDRRSRGLALDGTGDREYQVSWHYRRGKRRGTHEFSGPWPGLIALINEEYSRKHADRRGVAMGSLMRELRCTSCDGARLAPRSLAVRFAGCGIAELASRPVDALAEWLDQVVAHPEEHGLDAGAAAVLAPLHRSLGRRLESLTDVGLGYLNLDRAAMSLSGGEFQRVRLAAQLCSDLCGLTYVLDEPTTGLHAWDTDRLLTILRRLRDLGNTVVVVEHDLQVIRAADQVIDLGPGPGARGGRIVAQGTPDQVAGEPSSPTGRLLSQQPAMTRPRRRCLESSVSIVGASARNLKGIDIELPLGGIVAVSGVSGAGKSALVFEVLAKSLRSGRPVGCRGIEGHPPVIVAVDGPRGAANSSSTPATSMAIFDAIRARFADSARAKQLGLSKADFSFNRKGGRCETCQGSGQLRVDMGFLPDVIVPCESCHGARYGEQVLQVRVDGRTIADVLSSTADEALDYLADTPAIATPLQAMAQAGLGYLRLGQPADSLSRGEHQRLALAGGFSSWTGDGRWLLLDEPTKGLHGEDVSRLLQTLNQLVEQGHSVLVVEHHLEVLACSDWIVDLGPEGGAKGGTVVAAGTPEDVARCAESRTGACLQAVLR